tara:strand:+ start:257 stop:640 length:384 start_codon:yes stop_codon:yes gene_type:complete
MAENLEQLKTNKAALELLQNEANSKLQDFKQQISVLEKQIENYSKPKITPAYADKIYETVEKAVDGFDFSDSDNYDKEFGIDYDGRVTLEHFDFTNAQELVEQVVDKVLNLFQEEEAPEDDVQTNNE